MVHGVTMGSPRDWCMGSPRDWCMGVHRMHEPGAYAVRHQKRCSLQVQHARVVDEESEAAAHCIFVQTSGTAS